MGLNLNISRIIFSSLQKFDGREMRDLTVPEIKQIAGRAGRHGSKFPVGEVTYLDPEDLPLLHSSLKSQSRTLKQAGLFLTFDLFLLYSHQILEHFVENAKLSDNYFIAECEDMMRAAALIDELPLGLKEKYLFCISPVDIADEISSQGLTQISFFQEVSRVFDDCLMGELIWSMGSTSLLKTMQIGELFGSEKSLLQGHSKFRRHKMNRRIHKMSAPKGMCVAYIQRVKEENRQRAKQRWQQMTDRERITSCQPARILSFKEIRSQGRGCFS